MNNYTKKNIVIFIAIFSINSLLTAQEKLATNTDESFSGMFTNGKVSGQIREFSISRSVKYSDKAKDDYTRKANAIGGYLKFETAKLYGLSLGVAGYTTNGLFIGSPRTDYNEVDPTLLGKDNESYSILGEAYIQYKYSNTSLKIGRQKLKTPMAGPDDVRMLPNLYQAYWLTNKDIPDTTLIAGHITHFAQGTYGRTKNGGTGAATAGYSFVDSRNQVGDFVNMGTYAVDESTNGVSVVAVKYNGIKDFKMQLWDYRAYDILNIIYAQIDYAPKDLFAKGITPFVSAQYINEDSIGKEYIGDVDSEFLGLKAGLKVENLSLHVAYTTTSKNGASDSTLNHSIVSLWGGMPSFTKGMVSRHSFLAGTKATKVQATYNWKDFGPKLKTTIYYVNLDMHQYNGSTHGDASESGFDVKYNPSFIENFQARIRANFPRSYKVDTVGETQDWNEYRLILNYNF